MLGERLDESGERLGLELAVFVEVDDDEVFGSGFARGFGLHFEVAAQDAESGAGATLRLEFHCLGCGLAGLGSSVEQEKRAAAVKQRVGLPCRIVLDRKRVIGSGQRAFGVFGFESCLGEVAPDFLGRRAWVIGRCDEREALGREFEIAGVVGLDAAPLECLDRDVGGEIVFDRKLDFGSELRRVLCSEISQREENAGVFVVGIGAQGACGFEVFDRLAGLVAFDEPPTDPIAGFGAQVGTEVGDIFQKPLIAVHHFRDVVFLAA